MTWASGVSPQMYTYTARDEDETWFEFSILLLSLFHIWSVCLIAWLDSSSTQAIATIGFTESDSFLYILVIDVAVVVVRFCLPFYFLLLFVFICILWFYFYFPCYSQNCCLAQ